MAENKINILVTLDENYVKYLNIMLSSLIDSNEDSFFDVYVLHSKIREKAVEKTRKILGKNGELKMIKASEDGLNDAPVTARYPKEIYYRIFAAKYLPEALEKVLYLDPDVVVNGSLKELYNLDMGSCFFAAASHTESLMMHKVNELRLDMDEGSPYINSGVMLMNLKKLREEQNTEDVFSFIEKRRKFLILPDQDIISSLYGSRIMPLDTFRYNMTENLYMLHSPFEKNLNLDWVRKNSVIIHYCGRNKPWKTGYVGQLDVFYHEAEERMKSKGV